MIVFFLRGIVDADTNIYIRNLGDHSSIVLKNNDAIPVQPPTKHILQITTSDGETFPVKRKLLRPCLALTYAVQAGRGKYAQPEKQISCSAIFLSTPSPTDFAKDYAPCGLLQFDLSFLL